MNTNHTICRRCPSLSVSLRAAGLAFCGMVFAAGPAMAVTYYWDVNGSTSGVGGTGEWNSTNPYFSLSSGGRQATIEWPVDATSLVFRGTPGLVTVDGSFDVGQLTFEVGGYSLIGDGSIGTGLILLDNEDVTTVAATLTGGEIEVRGFGVGTLAYGKSDVFQGVASLILNGATFDMAGYNQSVANFTLTSDGAVTDRSGSGTSWLSVNGQLTAESGTIDVSVVGSGNLVKQTGGTVILNGSNGYTGTTTIYDGTLVINAKNGTSGATSVHGGTLQLGEGGAIAPSAITVDSGAYLTGVGSAFADVLLNGTVAPGLPNQAVGILTTGSMTWGSTGVFNWDINNAGGIAGLNWDLLDLQGNALSIEAGFTLKIIGLLDPSTGFDSNKSYGWLIAEDLSSVVGVDQPISILLNNVDDPRFSLRGDFTTRGLYLDFTPVPEPKAYAILLGVATLGLVGYRRWRGVASRA